MKKHLRLLCLLAVPLATFVVFFTKPVMVQVQSYHQFVDQRMFFGIPNTMDVLSNILFLIVGLMGLAIQKNRSWLVFFISIVLVAPGSAYYHWAPNDFTLIWDRLPMSVGFMALYVILLSEHVSEKLEKTLPIAVLMGLASVMVWVFTTDLRFYFWIQFSSFLTIPMILILYPSRYSHKSIYVYTLIAYALAKIVEVKDALIFEQTHHVISGHSLKHILAAVGIGLLWWMLKVRTSPRY
jgi:hypothetical protein